MIHHPGVLAGRTGTPRSGPHVPRRRAPLSAYHSPRRQSLTGPPNEKLKKELNLGGTHENLESYLKVFDTTLKVMQDEDALYRIAFELGEDAAKENVRYIEVRYAPNLHQRQGLPMPEIIEIVAEGLREAKPR